MASERAIPIGPGHGGPRGLEPRGGLERLLTLAEVADLLRLSEKTVHRLVSARRMPCVRVGRSVRFVSGDVLRWLSARKEG